MVGRREQIAPATTTEGARNRDRSVSLRTTREIPGNVRSTIGGYRNRFGQLIAPTIDGRPHGIWANPRVARQCQRWKARRGGPLNQDDGFVAHGQAQWIIDRSRVRTLVCQ